MNIQRFYAATAREALAKARMTFGDGTLILSNRPTSTGVEVVATAEDSLSALEQPAAPQVPPRRTEAPAMQPLQPRPPQQYASTTDTVHSPVQEDTEQLAMSTLSFQDYVRERMLRRRHEALQGAGAQPALQDHAPDQGQAGYENAYAPPAVPRSSTRHSQQPCAYSRQPSRLRSASGAYGVCASNRRRSSRTHAARGHAPHACACTEPARLDQRTAVHEGSD